MTGKVSILSVGDGDLTLSFDKSNPMEVIRAARVVKDMLKRGYALLVEVEVDGVKKYQRVREFDESTCSYVIADFDPSPDPQPEPKPRQPHVEKEKPQAVRQAAPPVKGKRGKRIAADTANVVAVGRVAGG